MDVIDIFIIEYFEYILCDVSFNNLLGDFDQFAFCQTVDFQHFSYLFFQLFVIEVLTICLLSIGIYNGNVM